MIGHCDGRWRRLYPCIGVAAAVFASLPMVAPGAASAQDVGDHSTPLITPAGLLVRLDALRAGLAEIERLAAEGDASSARRIALRIYLDHYEIVEALYGPGGTRSAASLSQLVADGEREFHRLLVGTNREELRASAASIKASLSRIEEAARSAGVPLDAVELEASVSGPSAFGPVAVSAASARSPEIREILAELAGARAAQAGGRSAEALALVESAYLERVEPLEARLPASTVHRIESLIHLQLRPRLARGAPTSEVAESFDRLGRELLAADSQLTGGSGFATVNAFAIIVREGLEAVLLIAAILAYLGAIGAEAVHRRRVWLGVALGIAASFATWFLARTLIPVSGASRELIEGITALVAVAVLLYVSNWLFQKTYMHDWKQYLREHVGRAVTTGSTLAMAGLACAAVYREGFETVLFYQALLFDAGAGAVLAGFVPGLLLIVVVGFAIVRLGVRLPLRTLFGVTNLILIYLAFVFLGKGLYNLQEAGLFSPLPISWLPDSDALRQVLGFYPVAQTLLAQGALMVTLLLTFIVHRRRAMRAMAALTVAVAFAAPAARLEAQTSSNVGTIVIAHGGDEAWNALVHEVVAEVRTGGPVEVSFLMGPGAATRRFQDVVAKLVAAGVRAIVVVPLLVSSHSGHYDQIRYLTGELDTISAAMMHHLRMAGVRRPDSSIPIRLARAVDNSPDVARVLADRAQALAQSPREHALFLVGHGPNSSEDLAAWMRNLREIADTVRGGANFRDVRAGVVQDDAPAAVRAEAVARVRDLIELQAALTGRPVVVVPVLISRSKLSTERLPTDLAGLPIIYSGDPLLPHPALARWIEARVRETMRVE